MCMTEININGYVDDMRNYGRAQTFYEVKL